VGLWWVGVVSLHQRAGTMGTKQFERLQLFPGRRGWGGAGEGLPHERCGDEGAATRSYREGGLELQGKCVQCAATAWPLV
jgi:hypothetical protein